jgi:hypothetical protein
MRAAIEMAIDLAVKRHERNRGREGVRGAIEEQGH